MEVSVRERKIHHTAKTGGGLAFTRQVAVGKAGVVTREPTRTERENLIELEDTPPGPTLLHNWFSGI